MEEIIQIEYSSLASILKLGRRHEIVNYEDQNFVVVKLETPLSSNILASVRLKLPYLPRYFYWHLRDKQVCLLRRYEANKFKAALEKEKDRPSEQAFLVNSLINIVKELHKREIFVGRKFAECIFTDKKRLMVEPGEVGSIVEDDSKLTLTVREWVKSLKECRLKEEL